MANYAVHLVVGTVNSKHSTIIVLVFVIKTLSSIIIILILYYIYR